MKTGTSGIWSTLSTTWRPRLDCSPARTKDLIHCGVGGASSQRIRSQTCLDSARSSIVRLFIAPSSLTAVHISTLNNKTKWRDKTLHSHA